MIRLIDFRADWCGPCRVMDPIVDELEKEMSGQVGFEKVNVDENSERASQAGVLSIPTYIIEKDGKEIDRQIGARSKDSFKSWIFSHL